MFLALKYSTVSLFQKKKKKKIESLGRENVEEKSINYPEYIQLDVFGQFF